MKTIKLLMMFLSLFILTNKTTAQVKKDTIYYLLDTLNTPVKDRLITVEKDGSDTFVRINCHCMKNYEIPVFVFNSKYGIPLQRKVFKSLNTLTLIRLMELARAVTSIDFQIHHVFYIIEPKGKDYVMYQSNSLSREITIGDQVPIKTGG